MVRSDSVVSSPVAPSPSSAPLAKDGHREPEAASPGLVLSLVLAQYGAYLALLTPVVVSLSLRVTQLAPHDKASTLGLVLGVGSLFALLSNPLTGALSDRTTSRFGKRRPWLLGGMVAGTAGLGLVGAAGNVTLLTVGWSLTQFGVHATLASLGAAIADFVPDRQRGRVSGALGLTPNLAMLTGAYGATQLTHNNLLLFGLPALGGLAAVTVLVVVLRRDTPTVPGELPPFGLAEFGRSFWFDPRGNPDFAWNFLGRFLVFIGMSCVTSYQFFFVTDQLGRGPEDAVGVVATSTFVLTAVGVVCSLSGGWISDRIRRRKPFVAAASLVVALSLGLLYTAHSEGAFYLAMGVYACGFGLYMAVDVALAVSVLPDPRRAAKDMGVLNVANALPQSLVPMIAPLLLTLHADGGSQFGELYLFGAVCGIGGALAVARIRTVR
ncbi:MFS transporter [Streptomyces phaeolivaceus]|uniref:MFS transporter n=1 Tax=Streptomyces phaeolivaceus TaxID=2653200 RepID=A0A5P8KEG8_9ACTN|nr:MFS transporter [Streptomyces phaeolivaceus]QFR01676.1 MFS transporter [Streptomyces phaeolivaceus]